MGYIVKRSDDPLRGVANAEKYNFDEAALIAIDAMSTEVAKALHISMIVDVDGLNLLGGMQTVAEGLRHEKETVGWEVNIVANVREKMLRRLFCVAVSSQEDRVAITEPDVKSRGACLGCLGAGQPMKIQWGKPPAPTAWKGRDDDSPALIRGSELDELVPKPVQEQSRKFQDRLGEMRGRGVFDRLLMHVEKTFVGMKRDVYGYKIDVRARVSKAEKPVAIALLGNITLFPLRASDDMKKYYEVSSWWELEQVSGMKTISQTPIFSRPCPACLGLQINYERGA